MAFTTYAAFVTALAGLTVAGVATKKPTPPRQIAGAQMPLSFPRVPSITRQAITMTSVSGLKHGTAELAFVIGADDLGMQADTFATVLALVDAIDTALSAASAELGIDSWSIAPEYETIAGTPYWILVATVEASG